MTATLVTGQVAVATTPQLIVTVENPNGIGVLISSSAAAFIGGSAVTTGTGFPVPVTTPVTIPTSAADPPFSIYAVTASAATVSFAYMA
jgi:hypothetical protein